jgi:predicted kinase
MKASHRYVMISGIPGCGKTTLGRALAQHLDAPYLDKDAFLEALFEESGCPDEETRQRLSRLADRRFKTAALGHPLAVLDSFWRNPSAKTNSGTPSSWLTGREIGSVEVCCSCPPALAAIRFLERRRHDGHFDSAWDHGSLVAQSRQLMSAFPLRVGATFEVDTTDLVHARLLARQVQLALDFQQSAEPRPE